MNGRENLCLALDCADEAEALRWVERSRSVFGVYKIGLELFCAEGPTLLRRVRAAGADRIFLDLKLHDIPRTVERAIMRLGGLGADYITIHSSGGPAMLQAAARASERSGLLPLAVTVLTSLNEADLSAVGVQSLAVETVLQRARLCIDSGIRGLVSSPREVARLRDSLGAEAFLVTPGIRLASSEMGDQKRVSGPEEALKSGADLLVVGRAVTAADDPEAAMAAFAAAVSS